MLPGRAVSGSVRPQRGRLGAFKHCVDWVWALPHHVCVCVVCDSFNVGLFVCLFHRRSNFRNITNLPELKIIKAVGFPPTSTQSLSKG